MKLTSYAFEQHAGSPQEWRLEPVTLEDICLFVGKNASGKSRLLASIKSLSDLLAGRVEQIWQSGTWNVSFEHDSKRLSYQIAIDRKSISYEKLLIDGEEYMVRHSDGSGEMLSREAGRKLSFKIPANKPAAARVDEIQYDYLSNIQYWASSLRKYEFGSEFGRNLLHGANIVDEDSDLIASDAWVGDTNQVVRQYIQGYSRFGAPFDDVIISDMNRIGYEISKVDAVPFTRALVGTTPPLPNAIPVALEVVEEGISAPVNQVEMSNGMFRALAMIISLNYVVMAGDARCLLIDDIGEGLDYERSTSLIQLLIKKCENSSNQLLMTTNDRFVMNETPLEYWHVINRDRCVTSVIDYENSKNLFDRFKRLGLSNFDFFSRDIYLTENEQ